jgi:hypothetical protein
LAAKPLQNQSLLIFFFFFFFFCFARTRFFLELKDLAIFQQGEMILVLFVSLGLCAPERLVWMCLDRCHDQLKDGLAEISAHANLISAVSYEAFDLGLGGKLVYNNFADPTSALASLGLARFPMITTASNALLLDLFWLVKNPPIIADAVALAVKNNYTGFNIDFEPDHPMSDLDAEKFAQVWRERKTSKKKKKRNRPEFFQVPAAVRKCFAC